MGMGNAYLKDILRTVKKGWKRFLSISIITALGVAMLVGLYASCIDLYRSADKLFDEQRLFDVRIISTLGLTNTDVDKLSSVSGVESAVGSFSENTNIKVDGINKTAEIIGINKSNINLPYILEGRIPEKTGEIVVTNKFIMDSKKAIGDTITIDKIDKKSDSDERNLEFDVGTNSKTKSTLKNENYTITGIVIDVMNIQNNTGAASIVRKSSAETDYSFFVVQEEFDSEIFTSVYLILDAVADIDSFSDEYEDNIQEIINQIDKNIRAGREKARYDSVVTNARSEVSKAKNEIYEEFSIADKEISDAWAEIEKSKKELQDGESTLIAEEKDIKRKISDARKELNDTKSKLENAEKELLDGEKQLIENEQEVEKNSVELAMGRTEFENKQKQAMGEFDKTELQFSKAQLEIETARNEILTQVSLVKSVLGNGWKESEFQTLANVVAILSARGFSDEEIIAKTQSESIALSMALPSHNNEVLELAFALGKINGSQQVLNAQIEGFDEQKKIVLDELSKAEKEIVSGEEQLLQAKITLAQKREELENGKVELEQGKAELQKAENILNQEEVDANKKLSDAWNEISDSKKELSHGEEKLKSEESDYLNKKHEAEEKIEDAYARINDLDKAQWYILDRYSLDGYSSLVSDLSAIEAVGRVFPVIFLLVAVLMSLTTMTRMVEEERGLIGTYKALGFGSLAIYFKYILFAFTACIFGGVLGDLFGFVIMPKFIFIVLKELYVIPQLVLDFDMPYGVGGVLLFLVAIISATFLACKSELSQRPARLMRPKTPKAGARVAMEHFPLIWNKLGFLHKVTVRNLFRYKKRLFMTIGGIAGCTALILCGFAIKDSIDDLSIKQYQQVNLYDIMAVFEEKNSDDTIKSIVSDEKITEYIPLRIENVKLMNNDGDVEKVQLMVIADGYSIENYINIEGLGGEIINPCETGIIVTQNASEMLNLKEKSTAFIQDTELLNRQVEVSTVVKNYLGNNIYITQSVYEKSFGKFKQNAILANLNDSFTEHKVFAETILNKENVLSVISTKALLEEFGFDLIYAIVSLIVLMAGGLAFVVLFTLSSTNISERLRELATIKVLGFYDGEVHQYINRETFVLSSIGIIVGLPLGRFISSFLTSALKMPSIYFAVKVDVSSYLISAGLTFIFTVIVSFITNKVLNKINMVEALKAVE